MVLKPLKQWFCDRCGEVIAKPEDGLLHWRTTNGKVHSFEILHRPYVSPRGGDRPPVPGGAYGCFPPNIESDPLLKGMLGSRGLAALLAEMDPGAYFAADGDAIGAVEDIRNWVETIRRLHIPFYEQARRYFKRARLDGELGSIDPASLSSETLKHLIERYEHQSV